jgi:signal transduction histidine kinase
MRELGQMPQLDLAVGLTGFALAIWCLWRHYRQAGRLRDVSAQKTELTRRLSVAAAELRRIAIAARDADGAGRADFILHRMLRLSEDMSFDPDMAYAPRQIDTAPVTLGEAVSFALAQISAALAPAVRSFTIAPDLEKAILQCDRRALHQILLAVLGDATVSTQDHGIISLGLTSLAEGQAIIIEDEGEGLYITPDKTERCQRGIGMGLSLARTLTASHGGSLYIETAPKIGTRVSIVFPHTAWNLVAPHDVSYPGQERRKIQRRTQHVSA